ncbi:hypothetical protein L2750_18410 [Shewanella submarina]|uniref:Lipoprotein n=1 Tax=Shewanella submarina TaxID=2016376 RepID=A0ABV7GHZ8_9GAMM|nr:hypothetical protein [Shewanella submarina]MCL1039108.1 hypothetical protein [Shewanella submarina]
MRKLHILTAASLLTLTACGGGGDSDDGGVTPTPPPPQPSDNLQACSGDIPGLSSQSTDTDIQFWLEPAYAAAQPVSIVATIPNSVGALFKWRQLSGTSVELVSSESPVLAMELPQSGDYEFELTVNRNGQQQIASVNITASAQNTNTLNVRLDHQVAEGDGISLRLDDTGASGDASWCQVSGPALKADLDNADRPLMTAPQVSSDSVIHIRASRNNQTDDVYLLVTDEPAIGSNALFDTQTARVHAYNPDSNYASAVEKCIYNTQVRLAQCTVSELPLLGQVNSTPNLDSIMNRVLVSHDWMGDNFKAFLQNKDPDGDFAQLLQSVTAVVISYDIRPSFYWVATGAIYLDPSDLWLTPAQRDTINEAPDFRSGFGNDLQFLMPWRYIKDNNYASDYYSPAVRTTRTLDDIEPDLASLLYHELAHANDFFPSSIHNNINAATLYDEFVTRNDQKLLISDQLTSAYPLQSSEMRGLAQVRFMGETANATQKAYLPADITNFFSNDIASDFYAYSTTREDAAMLFEEAMMSHRLGIQRDVAVTNSPEQVSAETVIVDWGQRGRIGDNTLQSRAALVLDKMMPGIGGNTLVAGLPEPVQMNAGQSWAANLVLGSSQQSSRVSANSQQTEIQPPLRLSGDRHKLPTNDNQ